LTGTALNPFSGGIKAGWRGGDIFGRFKSFIQLTTIDSNIFGGVETSYE